jgi:RNA polymerase sigma-70 factor (ECF subfamily)
MFGFESMFSGLDAWLAGFPLLLLLGSVRVVGTDTSREQDLAMVERARRGDALAYKAIVEKYQNRVYQLTYGVLRNQEDASDVTQDAFVKAYRSLDTFRGGSFYTWLFRVAMNLAIDLSRKRKRRGEHEGYDDDIGADEDYEGPVTVSVPEQPGTALERKALYKAIMDAMDQLPPEQRQVMVLRELEGLTYTEISEILDLPEGTVMSRLYYARRKLQKLLENVRGQQ